MLGSAQLGFYSLAFQFSSLPLQKFVTLLNSVAFPSFSSVQADAARLRRYFLTLVNGVALLTFPMFIGLYLVADSAVVVLLGSTWLPVVFPLKVLSLVSCFRAIESINAHLTIARGQPRVAVVNSLLGAIVLPASFYFGARSGGIDGVAVAWLVTRPFLFVIVTMLTVRVIGLTFLTYLHNLRHPATASLVMFGAVVATRAMVGGAGGAIADLLISIPVGCATYLGYQALFNAATLREAVGFLPLQRFSFLQRGARHAVPDVKTSPAGNEGMPL
jgi:O-antigen/teichoic acid export membrane protein